MHANDIAAAVAAQRHAYNQHETTPPEQEALLHPDELQQILAAMNRPDFGWALRQLDLGHRVARQGWNGKSVWLALSPGAEALPAVNFWAGPNRDYALTQPDQVATVLPCITMKTATGEILMGWLASQTDMLAVDWVIVP